LHEETECAKYEFDGRTKFTGLVTDDGTEAEKKKKRTELSEDSDVQNKLTRKWITGVFLHW
jgi:hypothetical protein